MNHNDTNSNSNDLQTTFDGDAINANVLRMRSRVSTAFGIDFETATGYVETPTDANEWNRVLAVDGATDVDPHFFSDPDRRMAFLWTAEVAGQTGQRAADLSIIHMETNGEIETFFSFDKYAPKAFDDMPEDVADGEHRFYLMNEAGSPGDQVLEVFDGGNGLMFDSWGHRQDGMNYRYVEGCEEFRVLDPENHPVQVIHTDMLYEHTDPVTIATTDGVFKFASRGGVMWSHDYDAPEWAWDAAADLYRGELEGYESVGTGWHSSLEKSELSDLINEITGGEFHDSAPSEIDPAPVIVKFSGTGNVCSVGISVFTTPEFAPTLEKIVSDARAAPGYAGVGR